MMTSSILNPLKDIKVLKYQIPAFNLTPNTSIQNKPLIICKAAFVSGVSASKIEEHLRRIGEVEPAWRYTMYTTSHFHSTTHELLCITRGTAKLCFGHQDNPSCIEEVAKKGDVIVVPAGVAHRLVEDVEGGFEMVGAYPRGKSWDMCFGRVGEEEKVRDIGKLGWFGRDPVYGDEGPVLEG